MRSILIVLFIFMRTQYGFQDFILIILKYKIGKVRRPKVHKIIKWNEWSKIRI